MELKMENRLCLNKRVVYELPDEVLVGLYDRGYVKPDFKPDICISSFGTIGIRRPEQTVTQIWIKTDNKELIDFIRNFNFLTIVKKIGKAYRMSINQFKKIILEEFYGEKYGE